MLYATYVLLTAVCMCKYVCSSERSMYFCMHICMYMRVKVCVTEQMVLRPLCAVEKSPSVTLREKHRYGGRWKGLSALMQSGSVCKVLALYCSTFSLLRSVCAFRNIRERLGNLASVHIVQSAATPPSLSFPLIACALCNDSCQCTFFFLHTLMRNQ